MAEYLIAAARRTLMGGALAAGLLACVPSVLAQELADPTRPPSSFMEGNTGDVQQAASGPVLQSVLISPRRREAIISGQTVKVGDSLGESKVVRITENEVVLRTGKALQTLKAFPGIEKQRTSGRAGIQLEKQRQ